MKTVVKIVILLSFNLISKTNLAQAESIPYYDHLNFQGRFFVIAENDTKNNYYAVDLTQLHSPLEKKYFENLAFRENKLIRIDVGNTSVAWFKVKKIYRENEIDSLLISLKNTTVNFVGSMSETEKQAWMTENAK